MNSGTKLFDFNTFVPPPVTISPPPLILALPPLTPSLPPTCEPPSALPVLVLNILLRSVLLVVADLGGLDRVLEYTLPPIIETEEVEEEGSLILVLARKFDENFESAELGGKGEFRVPPPIPPAPPLLLLVPDLAVVLREDEVKSRAKGDLVGILI